MIRVLVADDSPTARAHLIAVLASDPAIEVVAEARDGREAVLLTQRLRPDVVTMDIAMPNLDGFEATREIMAAAPTPIVVVTGSLASGEVSVSMQALRAGALCVLRKPNGSGTASHAREARQLVCSVKAMSAVKVVRHQRAAPPAVARPGTDVRARAVAIAASTGGPAVLHRLFAELPVDFGVPILVVQHMTTGFTPGLAAHLNATSPLRVKVAEAGEPLAGRTVYIAPDDRHLAVSGTGAVVLSSAPAVAGFRPSATILFESVACAFGPAALAVVLTGMGQDGVTGIAAIKAAGGRVLAQDEETSVVFGMPAAAIATGQVDRVVPVDELATTLLGLVRKETS